MADKFKKVEYLVELTFKDNVLPPQLMHERIEKFGAYAIGGTLHYSLNTKRPNDDTISEMERFLPKLIGIDSKSPDWNAQVIEYFNNFTVNVTAQGLTLIYRANTETGELHPDATNQELQDYMVAKHLKNHPHVAFAEEEVDNRDLYRAVLQDINKVKEEKIEEELVKASADEAYVLLVADLSKKENLEKALYIANLNKIYDANLLSESQLKVQLREIKETNPVSFTESCSDKNLKHKVIIEKGLSSGEITQEGNTYFIGDDRIGTYDQCVAYIADAKNAQVVLKLTERINKTLNPTL